MALRLTEWIANDGHKTWRFVFPHPVAMQADDTVEIDFGITAPSHFVFRNAEGEIIDEFKVEPEVME